ncbi:hypothetical protein K525DRAFT_184034 [Schizophyllum commune Loenen D]|nr:hypothetical protein K525DRAFT_184034 [Schizophyllum commune Loenen D]
MPPTDFTDRLAALSLPAVNGSSTACSCALAILKLLPQADLDDQIKEAIDAQAAHEAALKANLEKDPSAFVVSAHLAYCTLCKQDVPLEAHYSKADWERHCSTCHPAAKVDNDCEALPEVTREGPTSEPPCKHRQGDTRDEQAQIIVDNLPALVKEEPSLEYKASDASAASVRKTPRTPRKLPQENSFRTHAQSPTTKHTAGAAPGQRASKVPFGPSRSMVNVAGFPTTSTLTTGSAKLGRDDAESGSSPTP